MQSKTMTRRPVPHSPTTAALRTSLEGARGGGKRCCVVGGSEVRQMFVISPGVVARSPEAAARSASVYCALVGVAVAFTAEGVAVEAEPACANTLLEAVGCVGRGGGRGEG